MALGYDKFFKKIEKGNPHKKNIGEKDLIIAKHLPREFVPRGTQSTHVSNNSNLGLIDTSIDKIPRDFKVPHPTDIK